MSSLSRFFCHRSMTIEKCNYYIGGWPDNPIYVKTRLQRWCADSTYANQSTCLAFCGKKLP